MKTSANSSTSMCKESVPLFLIDISSNIDIETYRDDGIKIRYVRAESICCHFLRTVCYSKQISSMTVLSALKLSGKLQDIHQVVL